MKLTKLEKEIIKALVTIDDEIYDIYKNMSEFGENKESINTLKDLFEKEDMLYKRLNLNNEKIRAISNYICYLEGFEYNKDMPGIFSDNFNKYNYPFYRITKRIRYELIGEFTSIVLNVDSIRKELLDTEVMQSFNSTIRYMNDKHDKKVKLWSYLLLIESPSTEKFLLDNDFEYQEHIMNSAYLKATLTADRQADVMSKIKNVNYYIEEDKYAEAYAKLVASRVNEILNGILYTIVIFTKFCGGKCDDDLYEFMLIYLKSLVSLCSTYTRLDLYKKLQSKLDESTDKDKIVLEKMLNEAIKDIERDYVPTINNVSIKLKIK